MRQNRRCPKCQSYDVIEVVGHKHNQYQIISLTKWGLKNAVLDRYICADCGYTEEYVQLNEKFRAWAKKNTGGKGGSFNEYV